MQPLQGFRVLDLSNVLAGPFCAYQLALLGADVVKIERPESGDLARQLGADPSLNRRRMGASFLAQNAGKRSVTLNLKSKAGKEAFLRLVEKADVVVENFRPGVMKRLGLGWEELRKANPRLVYCAVTGYGQTGPLADAPAYDQIVQGMSGVMSVSGDATTAPLRVGYPMADTIGGLTAALAISSALVRRLRTDEGAFIDVAMLDATLVTMGWVVSNWLIAETPPRPMGNDNFTAAPSGTFRTGSCLLNIAANKQEQFENLVRVLGLEHLRDDPRFADAEERKRNRAALNEEIQAALLWRTAEEWESLLGANDVPAGRVLTVPEVLRHPQVAHRGLLRTFDAGPIVGRPITLTGAGYQMTGAEPALERPPPTLGEHTDEVLREAGFTPLEIEAMREDGAI